MGRGISYCATCDGGLYRGRTIAVLCGNPRFEHEVRFLAGLAGKLYFFPYYKNPGVAGDSLCMLVVCNTASIQLLPTTVAAVRLAAGCRTPFDILPAVWVASLCSVTVGVLAAKGFARLWRTRP